MKQKDILLILVPSFLMVVAWIIFSILHNSAQSTISQPLSVQVIQIQPNFNTNVVNDLKKRERINPMYSIEGQTEDTDEASAASELNLPINQNSATQSARL